MTVAGQNVQAIRDAYVNRQSSGNFLPAVYVVEPTSRCALDCVMCPQSELRSSDLGEMPVERAERIAQAIGPTAELVMLYFMGEPLQHHDLDGFLKAMRRHVKGRLVISTNAMGLKGQHLAALLENRVDIIIACIDRFEKNAYERIRRGAHFETVVGNVEALLEARNPEVTEVLVKTLDFNMPAAEKTAFVDYWRRRGAHPLIGWVDTWANQMPGLAKLTASPPPYAGRAREACADLWFKMVINWRGEAILCCHNFDSSIPLGSIDGPEDIAQTWQGRRLRDLRAEHLRGNWTCTSLCEGCREWASLPELDAYLEPTGESLYLVF